MLENLLELDEPALKAWLGGLGQRPFRADQLFRWIHQRYEFDFQCMTDLAKSFRHLLQEQAQVRPPEILTESCATDGTRKWLLDVGTGNAVETVYIPEERRATLCVSSQAGCALNCAFCATGQQGFNRNLSVAEIIGQLWFVGRLLKENVFSGQAVSNVVFMGMGEPLANFQNVQQALQILLSSSAYGLSRRRVTVSTAGIVPAMDRLAETCPVALAVSLHAPEDSLRDYLVPINKKYPLKVLLEACRRYARRAPRGYITFEYVMLHEVNDTMACAQVLIRLLADVPCKINLIPWNEISNSDFKSSTPKNLARFSQALEAAGLRVTTRKVRGETIDAACGQLAGRVSDRTRRSLRIAVQQN